MRPDDITSDAKWVTEQQDRLIAFELLQRSLHAEYAPISDSDLAGKIGVDNGTTDRIIASLKLSINERL